MPLYSLIVQADAVAFAILHKGKSSYKGLACEDSLIPKVKSDITKECSELEHWGDLKQYWALRLLHTAQEFMNGITRVDPINERDICKFCDQKTLCRKTELLNHFNGEDE